MAKTRQPSRLSMSLSVAQVISEMSQKHPEAKKVCREIYARSDEIDPHQASPGLTYMIWLDELEIYGAQIYTLYKKVCGEDLIKFMALIRAYQLGALGGITADRIKRSINEHSGKRINFDVVLEAVQKRLYGFNQ